MVVNGRLQCLTRRRLYMKEQLEWDLLCIELGIVHSLNANEDTVDVLDGFTVKKCYEFQLDEAEDCDFVRFLWKKNIPHKVSFMLWGNFHDSLPSYSMSKHRNVIVQDDKCLFCKREEETSDHFLLCCQYAFEVWSHFFNAFKICWVAPNTVKKHFEAWKLNNLIGKCREIWWKVIYAVFWYLWKERNNRSFGGRDMEVEELILLIKQTIFLWFLDKDAF
ncbi:uncharacterized protein LOC113295894 [Papaver somniferum]|uniref:uncharacterized protein LOC113295894 n=1 Tax=Papaver somniferum TaxID=3469 RepID=UPI000E701BBB|nr:uncharacterized protein LOC113295894 [Papaver somniferum]